MGALALPDIASTVFESRIILPSSIILSIIGNIEGGQQTGWSMIQTGPDGGAWTRAHIERDQHWLLSAPPVSKREIAVLNKAWSTKGVIPADGAPDLQALFSSLPQQVEDGPGFRVVRGLPITGYDVAFLDALTAWLGGWIGTPRCQDAAGTLIGHVTNAGDDYAGDPNARGYRSNQELVPHSDGSDLLALLCVRQGRAGGENQLVSTLEIHNRIARERPDLLDILFRGFHYALRDESEGGPQVTPKPMPIFVRQDGVLSGGYNGKSIRGGFDALGKEPTTEEREAIHWMEHLASHPDLSFHITLQPGDFLLVNNYTTLHSRSGFEDFEDPGKRRLMLRLWLTSRVERPLPPSIAAIARGAFEAHGS